MALRKEGPPPIPPSELKKKAKKEEEDNPFEGYDDLEGIIQRENAAKRLEENNKKAEDNVDKILNAFHNRDEMLNAILYVNLSTLVLTITTAEKTLAELN